MKKLVILDRDGVINYDSDDYIKSPAEWIPIPGSLQAIAKLTQQGYDVAIATNQSGLARGYYDKAMLTKIHEKLLEYVAIYGGKIAKIVYCPHLPEDQCECRKPKPGLLQQLADYFSCDLQNVPVIGDSLRDIQAALAVSARPILVLTGNGLKHQETVRALGNIEIFANLNTAVDKLLTIHH
ncbi:MAG: D-glycero-beta-D-manno-heptose 1,7-bisphosphate 7-phosphatase [Legionellales bacterium]|nr:D-glycero-beta-D-manno-heptose 1,7-bisphosphate 7-phosphatase [Legionellales bacterium]